jgi:aspartate/methionine/tyrosine aminotransferase
MRIGWVLSSNKVIIERIRKHVAFNVMCVNTLAQRVAEIAIAGDNPALAARKSFYFDNMRMAYERPTEIGWNVHYPEGSFYLFPKHGIAEPISAQILQDTGVAVIDGQHFGPSGAGHVRISCCVPRGVLKEGIERIVEWFKANRDAGASPARDLPQRAQAIPTKPSAAREIAGVIG